MKFAILGAGNTGKGNAAFLTEMGCQVILYDRDPARLAPLYERGITASGVISGHFDIPVTNQIEEAVRDSDVILVCTVALAHRPLAKLLKGLLQPHQIILVTNCCWGALEFDQELGEEADKKECMIAEVSGQLILCSSPTLDSVYLKSVKKHIHLACVHASQTAAAIEQLMPVFPQFQPASSILETSLNSTNPICHGTLVLFNITRIENGEDFLLFHTGVTSGVAEFMEIIDQERVKVVRACGIQACSLLEMFQRFWTNPKENLYQVFHNTPAYSTTKGPVSLEHRYITEDFPYGLVPYVRLGAAYNIPTPNLKAMVWLLGQFMRCDYFNQGPKIDKANLSRYHPNF